MSQNKHDSRLWGFLERIKVLAELMGVIIVLAPILFAALKLLKDGLTAVVPAWFIVFSTIFALLLGYLIGRKVKPNQRSIAGHHGETVLQKIDFDYDDDPQVHGWEILLEDGKVHPNFNHISDGFVGRALQIKARDFYGMDKRVNPVAEIGSLIELLVKVESGYGIYARVSIQSKDGSKSEDVWLNFQVGSSAPQPYGDGKNEWFIYVIPEQYGGDWLLFRINLRDAIKQSFGKNGWSLRKLRGFRLRGNLSIAYFTVFDS